MGFGVPANSEAVAVDGAAHVDAEAGVVGLSEDGVGGLGDKFGEDEGVCPLEDLGRVSFNGNTSGETSVSFYQKSTHSRGCQDGSGGIEL